MSAQLGNAGRQRLLPLDFARLRNGLDPVLCLSVAILLAWGIVMVASASVAVGDQARYGSTYYFLERQLLFLALGLSAGLFAFGVPMSSWQRLGPLLLLAAFVFLLLVLVPGVGTLVKGARRWIDFRVFRLQVSEPARLAAIIYLAGYIVRRQEPLRTSFKGLAMPFIPLAIISLLLLLEPDFGATAILMGVAMLMLFLGGARLDYLGALLGVVSVALALLVYTAAYRMKRMGVFLDPWADPFDKGLQLTQSLIAVGRGEVFGVGLGNSLQKLLYLPEMHTDFIFAILAEEFGLVGITVLLALFGTVVWRGFAIGQAAEARDERFKAYLCYGLSGWLGLQATINMAVNMGMLPTKGLTLPFISYGGSSLVTVCVLVALILRVDHENRRSAASAPSAGMGGARRSLPTGGGRWGFLGGRGRLKEGRA
jgi:cell division protein FtsW